MIRFIIAQIISKIIYFLMRLLGKNATYLPGKIAEKICKNYLEYIKKPKVFIAITGTNGKTTTSNMTLNALNNLGLDVANNSLGSNTKEGIIALMVKEAKLNGKLKKDYLVLEVDERSTPHVFLKLKPDYILITNLFRDSIYRNAHPDFIKMILEEAIPKSSTLIVNGDDLISSYVAIDNKRVVYSLKEQEFEGNNIKSNIVDIIYCPKCDHLLESSFIRHHHIGRLKCPNCGFTNLKSDFIGDNIDLDKNTFEVIHQDKKDKYNLVGKSITDITNQLALITLLNTLGFTYKEIKNAFKDIKVMDSRFKSYEYKGIKITKVLAKEKNPVSTSRILDYIRKRKGNKMIIFLNNATDAVVKDNQKEKDFNYTDNISWYYDIDFEYLKDDKSIKKIVVASKRYLDIKARLLLAGIEEVKLDLYEEPDDIENNIDLDGIDEIYILSATVTLSYGKRVEDGIKRRLDNEN